MASKQANKNIVVDLMARQTGLGSKCELRRGQKILKKLISSPTRYYKSMYEFDLQGHSHITLLHCGRLLVRNRPIFSDMTPSILCLPGHTSNKKLPLLYDFPAKPQCLDVVKWGPSSSKVAQDLSALHSSHTSSVVYLTKTGCLIRRCLLTGKEKDQVYLGPPGKFEHLHEQELLGRIVVKSDIKRRGDVVVTLAIFSSPPLQLDMVFEVRKSVFGKSVDGAYVVDELLYVSHKKNILKVYSLEEIQQKKTRELHLGQKVEGGEVGKKPLGVPVNVVLSKEPTVLWQGDTKVGNFFVGGNPWKYIVSPDYLTVEIRLLGSGDLVASLAASHFDHFVNFHSDESERIIHRSNKFVELLEICPGGLRTCFRYEAPEGPLDICGNALEQQLITSFSPQLELLTVLRVQAAQAYSIHHMEEVVMLDNETGAQVCRVDLHHKLMYASMDGAFTCLKLDGPSMLITTSNHDKYGELHLFGDLFCLLEKNVKKFK